MRSNGGMTYKTKECVNINKKFVLGKEWKRGWLISSFLVIRQVQVLREVKQVYVEENVFLEDHAKVKEENIEIFKEINEDPIVEKEPEIEIVKAIREDHLEIVNH